MSRPKLEPHMRRFLNEESLHIGSLFEFKPGSWACSLYFPDIGIASVLNRDCIYAHMEGDTPEAAILAAHRKMWNGL